MFYRANDELVLGPPDTTEKMEKVLEEELKVPLKKATVYDSSLIGIYSAMNSQYIILPHLTYSSEIKMFKEIGLEPIVIKTKHTAIGNVVVLNDKGMVVSPLLEKSNVRTIEDAIGWEAEVLTIAGYNTVGATCFATNQGFLIHNNASDDEIDQVEKALGVPGINTTVNFGFSFPSYGVIANSKGYLVGETTTGIETMRIEQGLGFAKRVK